MASAEFLEGQPVNASLESNAPGLRLERGAMIDAAMALRGGDLPQLRRNCREVVRAFDVAPIKTAEHADPAPTMGLSSPKRNVASPSVGGQSSREQDASADPLELRFAEFSV